MGKNSRESNLELLRIVSIIMILGLHYNLDTIGGAFAVLEKGTLNYYMAYFFESAFIISVNCFILISGYFMINQKQVKIRKIVNLISIVMFYNVGLYLLNVLIGVDVFSLKAMILHSIQPKWFITVYIVLYSIAPFINIVINNIERNKFKILISLQLIFFVVWPSISRNLEVTPIKDRGYGIIHFITMYLIGAYIRKYDIKSKNNIKGILKYIVYTGSIFAVSLLTPRAWDYNFVLVVISSIVVFMLFLNIKISSKKINYLAQFTLGVFIIHTDGAFTRLVWGEIINASVYSTTNLYLIHFLGSIVVVYLICVIFDIIREKLFKNSLYRLYDKISFLNYTINI